MTKTKGYRRGTRDMFSRPFRKHGVIPLSTYMRVYKIGDFVDVKVSQNEPFCLFSYLIGCVSIVGTWCLSQGHAIQSIPRKNWQSLQCNKTRFGSHRQ